MAKEPTNFNYLLSKLTKVDQNLYDLLKEMVSKLQGFSLLDFDGIFPPLNARAEKGKLLFDRFHRKFQISENGRDYVDVQPHEMARVYNDADISIPNAALTALTFNSERYDTDQLHSVSANTGRFTARWPGRYAIGACVQFEINAVGVRVLRLRVNGTDTIASQIIPAGAIQTDLCIQCDWDMQPTDYVEAIVYQSSGGALLVKSSAKWSPEFWIRRVS